jgi:hypothetical protein
VSSRTSLTRKRGATVALACAAGWYDLSHSLACAAGWYVLTVSLAYASGWYDLKVGFRGPRAP